jgi:DNA-binding FadR family transcriptional regulator
VIDVLRSRRVLETAVVGYVVDGADESDYAERERSIDILRDHLGDRTAVMWADMMFHRTLVRASHNESMRAAMRSLERRIAPVRDAYSGGHYWDAHILDVHRRQVDAMRNRRLDELDAVLDDHFRMLEHAYCEALPAEWDDLFAHPGRSKPSI